MNTKNSFLNLRNNNDFRSKRNIKSGTNKPLVIQHFSSTDAKDWTSRFKLDVTYTSIKERARCPRSAHGKQQFTLQ
jgi:hypothetical protein